MMHTYHGGLDALSTLQCADGYSLCKKRNEDQGACHFRLPKTANGFTTAIGMICAGEILSY